MDRPVNFACLEPRAVKIAVQLAERGCTPRVVAMSLARSGMPRESAQVLADAFARMRRPESATAKAALAKAPQAVPQDTARTARPEREARAAAAALGWMLQTLVLGGVTAAVLWLAGTGLGYEAGFTAGAVDGFERALSVVERALLAHR